MIDIYVHPPYIFRCNTSTSAPLIPANTRIVLKERLPANTVQD